MSIQYHYNICNILVVPEQDNTTKYCTNFPNHKSFKSRIKQVAAVSLIFLSMITGEVLAGDKLPKSKASSCRKKEATFEVIHLSNNLPDVVLQLPLPDLIPSNPPAPSAPSLMPPIAPAIPYLLGSVSSNAPKQKTGFMQIIW
ncbi:hypothetical protein ASQ44_07480 (plasmid) [Rickettsia rhipicephali]|uniref:hypothetical protein n=1 Tax=Rickettsia rhipicephali TaxID=33992 RepID=UPI00070FA514|nr:hypothetical protein [Rickettsia rhipicephali]ALN41912.1 hypothetical protein ASQ44_07480 [Rickettsia rhipicephali]